MVYFPLRQWEGAAGVPSRQVTYSLSPNSMYTPCWVSGEEGGSAFSACPAFPSSVVTIAEVTEPLLPVLGVGVQRLCPSLSARMQKWHCPLNLHSCKGLEGWVLGMYLQAVWKMTLGLWMLPCTGFTQPGCVPVLPWCNNPVHCGGAVGLFKEIIPDLWAAFLKMFQG